MAGRPVSGRKAVAGRQRHDRAAETGAAAFAVGDARHRARGVFRFFRHGAQLLRRRFAGIFEIERGEPAFGQQFLRRQPGIGIFGRGAGHGHGAFGQFGQRRIAEIAGMDRSRPAADEHPQARRFAFGAFDIFQRAEAHLHPFRHIADGDRVGGISPETAGKRNQRVAPFLGTGKIEHGRPFANGIRRTASPDQSSASSALIISVSRNGNPMARLQIRRLSRR